MLGVAAQRIVHLIRKPRNNADECHCAETRRDGAFRAICFVAPLARGACHGPRVASRISFRKASVAATRGLFRGSLMASAGARRCIDGVLLLDKPNGLSSNAALQRAKRLDRAQKAGHTGTLDPLATGLLPICFGEATKFAHLLPDPAKTYLATLRLGVTTTTGDAEGEVRATRPVVSSLDDVQAVLPRFVGRIAQVPPRHSALKRDGRKYYEYAREGVEIVRTAREVEVHAIALGRWRGPDVELRIHCGKGTYI